MNLADFPVEVLAQIFNGPSSWAVIELWKAGCINLNRKLARGVTHIDLIDTFYNSKSRWPCCLKEFVALESLTIERPRGPLGTPESLRVELKQLSSTLKVLSLHADDLPTAFFPKGEELYGEESDDESNEASEDERPAKRAKLTETADENRPHLEMWNLDTTFPQLERLELGIAPWSENAVFPGNFGSVVFSLLPRSLTCFEFPYEFADGELEDLSTLPSGLQTLRLPSDSIYENGLATLPKSLTDIGYSLDSEETICKLIRDPEILPNLIKFPALFDPYESDTALACFIDESIKWPDSMCEMALSDYENEDVWRTLPKTLTSLQLDGEHQPLTAASVAILPRGLTALLVSYVDWSGIDAFAWPPSLTRFIVTKGLDFGLHCFQMLPRSLRSLDVEQDLDEDRPGVDQLATDFDALRKAGRELLAKEIDQWTKIKEWLMTPAMRRLGDVDKYIENVELGKLFGLPLTLTQLCILQFPELIQVKLFPPYMRHFECEMTIRVDDDIMSAFPPSNSAYLQTTVRGPSQEHRHPVTKMGLESPSLSALCASNITSLEVSFKSRAFEKCGFQYLPRGLINLKFSGPAVMHLRELKDLPPTLETLTIDFPFSTPNEPWTHLLPRSLELLDTEGVMYGSDFENLPPQLAFLRANIVKATLDHVRRLPRTLRFVKLVGNDCNVEEPYLSEKDWTSLFTIYRPFWRIREAAKAELEASLSPKPKASGQKRVKKVAVRKRDLEPLIIFQDTDPKAHSYPESDSGIEGASIDDEDEYGSDFSASFL